MPAAVVRHFMAGPGRSDALVREVQTAVGATTPEVMAIRSMERCAPTFARSSARDAILVLAGARSAHPRRGGRRDPACVPTRTSCGSTRPMILQRAPHACLAHVEELASCVWRRGARAPRRGASAGEG
jgi:hypothetical protein